LKELRCIARCFVLNDGTHVGVVKPDLKGRRCHDDVCIGIDASITRGRSRNPDGLQKRSYLLSKAPELARFLTGSDVRLCGRPKFGKAAVGFAIYTSGSPALGVLQLRMESVGHIEVISKHKQARPEGALARMAGVLVQHSAQEHRRLDRRREQ
jgi:hypothetical protein